MAAPETQVTLVYSEPMLRRVAWALWRRAVGWRGGFAYVLGIAFLVVELLSGDRSWLVGMVGTVLVVATAAGVSFYRVVLSRSLAKFRRLGEPKATFEILADRFRVISGGGNIELPWDAVSEVWRLPEFWIFFSSRAYYMTFPLTAVDVEAQDLVLAKLRGAGAKVS